MPPPRPAKGASKPWLKGQADDLASLANLDETILLEELRYRYDEDKIYVRDIAICDVIVASIVHRNSIFCVDLVVDVCRGYLGRSESFP